MPDPSLQGRMARPITGRWISQIVHVVAKLGISDRPGGSIAAGQDRKITLPAGSVPLNNGGDNVALIDDRGEVRHRVDYTAAQASSGRETPFD